MMDPLPGQEKAAPTPAQVEEEGADFMALMMGGQGIKVGGA